jgi:hypothetical protein
MLPSNTQRGEPGKGDGKKDEPTVWRQLGNVGSLRVSDTRLSAADMSRRCAAQRTTLLNRESEKPINQAAVGFHVRIGWYSNRSLYIGYCTRMEMPECP